LFKPYTRSGEMTDLIIIRLRKFMEKYPNIRMGCLFTNIFSDYAEFDALEGLSFIEAGLLWNVFDETFLRRLELYGEWIENDTGMDLKEYLKKGLKNAN
jgi:hypothetical protein